MKSSRKLNQQVAVSSLRRQPKAQATKEKELSWSKFSFILIQSSLMDQFQGLTTEQSQKVQKLCKLYGLNHQQTLQLLNQLRTSTPQQSTPPSSVTEDLQNFQSFKDQFKTQFSFKERAEDAVLKNPLYKKILQENQNYRKDKQDLQEKLTILLRLKEQQADVIIGLKDNLNILSNILKDKQLHFNQLSLKYESMLAQSERSEQQLSVKSSVREVSSRRTREKQNNYSQMHKQRQQMQQRKYKQVLDQLRNIVKH